ncbi:glycosyltransferase family 8 protein [Lacrimispora xylanisolvens]|uniref:glycosyltransferase family 8 protein n=1 Tax=Lacrimispora xylanisolvens TaxID=384636 RepID=UPI002402AC26
MNIVYASNDKFARHLAVSLYSLLDRNQKIETLDVWVLSMGLSRESKDRLCGIAQEFDRELSVIELGNLKERFSHEVDTGGFDLSIMARLFLGDVLPEHVERVLYLDCDTVILSSLEKLWKADLGPFLLGAVMEPTIYPCIKEEIGLRPEEPYFNSGGAFN